MQINPARIFFLILLALLLGACKASSPKYDALAPGAVVLAFGDSVTHGTGAKQGEDYPERLAARSGWKVVNAGIPGNTAEAAKLRIDGTLRENSPALVIIELGGNDFLHRRADKDVKEDLREILRVARKSGAITALIAVPEFSLLGAGMGSLSDSGIYSELAKEEGVLLVDGVLSKVLSDAALRYDQIHPNAEGYRVLADGISEGLAKAGLLKPR